MADDRKDKSSATPQAGDLRAFGPLGRPMTRDELVDGPEPKPITGRRDKPVAGDLQVEGALGRPLTKDELAEGKTKNDLAEDQNKKKP